jgi:hypothetical protein
MTWRLPAIVITLSTLSSLAIPTMAGAQPSFETVLSRASEYVADFERQLGGIVAEERYLQDVIPDGALTTSVPARSRIPFLNNQGQHRELKSDLLLIHPIGANRWVQFRDVFEVDGRQVRDRDNRLAKLFLRPSASMAAQVKDIQEESARYNIGNVQRDINVPLFALRFLESGVQSHFEFTRVLDTPRGKPGRPSTPQDMPRSAAFAVSPEAWEIQYKETQSPTMIGTTGDRDLPSHGRFWIDPLTGRVLMSEHILEDPLVYGAIDVSYQFEPALGFLVPIEMNEDYIVRSTSSHVRGTAKYGKFRKFQVQVDLQMAPVK